VKIIIKEHFASDFTSREAGEMLRNLILNSTENKIELDFRDLKVASASFFDEGLVKLFDYGWKEEDFTNRLDLQNIFHKDLSLFQKILEMKGHKINK
jgi:hypothetical protein